MIRLLTLLLATTLFAAIGHSETPAVQPTKVVEIGDKKDVTCLRVTPDGNHVVFVREQNELSDATLVQVWQLESGKKVREVEAKQKVVAISPDGKRLARFDPKGRLLVADLLTSKIEKQLGWYEQVHDIRFARAGDHVFVLGRTTFDYKKEVGSDFVSWDLATQQAAIRQAFDESPWCAAIFPDASKILAGTDEGRLFVLDTKSGELIKTLSKGNDDFVEMDQVAISSDGRVIASQLYQSKVVAWHMETGEAVDASPPFGDDFAGNFEFLPDSRILVGPAGYAEALLLVDVTTGKKIARLEGLKRPDEAGLVSPVGKLDVNDDGSFVAAIDRWNNNVYVWDISKFNSGASTTENDTPPTKEDAKADVLPRYKVASHSSRGETLTAKLWIDTPDGKLPTERQVRGIYEALASKTESRLVLHYYVPGMKLEDPPWAIASPDEESRVKVRRFDTRARQ